MTSLNALKAKEEKIITKFIKEECCIERVSKGAIELVRLLLSIKQAHPKINYNDNVFFPAARMQGMTRKYQEIRDTCCIRLECASAEAGRCDKIINWTQTFNDLFIDLAQERIRWEKKARKQRDAASKYKFEFFPGADETQYKKTETSNRFYHPAQNIPRGEKAILYHGCYDFDMVAAYPNIFYKLVLKDESHPMLDLCIRDTDHFLQLIIDHEAYAWDVRNLRDVSDRDRAKMMRSKLFHPPKHGKAQKVGVKWFDDLQQFIHEKIEDCVGKDQAHLFASAVEAELIERAFHVVGWDKICLRMHDGFIAMDIDNVDDVVGMLEWATGYRWKVDKF